MREHSIQQRILLALGRGLSRVFRVNTGVAWQGHGQPVRVNKPTQVMCYPGDVVLRKAQPIKMGLTTGGSDIIGWTTHVISDCEAGERVAIFTAIEVKSDAGKATDDQLRFIAAVQAAGGLAGVARSEAEALAIIAPADGVLGC